MPDVKKSLRELQRLATGDSSEFTRLLQRLLATDFEATFFHVKAQKLLLRRRSSAWISSLDMDMRHWLASAPLKGKQKAQVTRHLAICQAIQELLDIVDKQSRGLRIWQASTESLLRALFASVEELRLTQDARLHERELRTGDSRDALKATELIRMELRTHCDYVSRVVSQISIGGVREAGDAELAQADLREALSIAGLADLLMHVLDCYTYKNFRISIQDKHLTMHGVQTRFEGALTWSSLRERSSELLDSYPVAMLLKKLDGDARGIACDCETFADFLQSNAGQKLIEASHSVRGEYLRILEREVLDEIDLELTINTTSGTFGVRELLNCWSLLFQIATCARIWSHVFQKETVATLPLSQLLSLVVVCLGCTNEQAKRLISQFCLCPSNRNEDPFFRPLIKLDQETCLIAASFIETGRFSRNLFSIAIREGKVDFSSKGLKPLKNAFQKFVDAGFEAVLNFPVTEGGRVATDIDIAAAKDGFLFLGQTKVLIRPDTLYEGWKALESLKKAASQLRTSLRHTSKVSERLGLVEGEFLIVPFILTNIWNYTGATVDGFKVIDFSYLSMLLTGGETWAVRFEPVPSRQIRKVITGKYPTGEELSTLIRKPIHEQMFEKPEIIMRSVQVEDWRVTIPMDTGKVPATISHPWFDSIRSDK